MNTFSFLAFLCFHLSPWPQRYPVCGPLSTDSPCHSWLQRWHYSSDHALWLCLSQATCDMLPTERTEEASAAWENCSDNEHIPDFQNLCKRDSRKVLKIDWNGWLWLLGAYFWHILILQNINITWSGFLKKSKTGFVLKMLKQPLLETWLLY